ncbi:MAG: LysR family transcriptional regulator [Caulobacterales bacterium]
MLDQRLNHVVAAAQQGSFTAAARVVGVTQSAVTKSIAELERQLGYQIFHRTSRGALLTDEGRAFVDRATRLLEDAKELLREHAVYEDAFAGILRVGVCPASLEWQVVAPLTSLLARYPRLRFDVSGASFERVAQQLRNGDVDVAVGFEDAFAERPDFRREPLTPAPTTLFARKDHPILSAGPVGAADVAKYPFVAPTDSRPYGARIRDIYESQGVDAQSRIHTVDFFPLVKRIVATSDAISVVATAYAERASFKRSFAVLETVEHPPVARLCVAVRGRWEPKPPVRAFISACRVSLS